LNLAAPEILERKSSKKVHICTNNPAGCTINNKLRTYFGAYPALYVYVKTTLHPAALALFPQRA
jgi:hypothetical protein